MPPSPFKLTQAARDTLKSNVENVLSTAVPLGLKTDAAETALRFLTTADMVPTDDIQLVQLELEVERLGRQAGDQVLKIAKGGKAIPNISEYEDLSLMITGFIRKMDNLRENNPNMVEKIPASARRPQ